jgi:hypothetical protein
MKYIRELKNIPTSPHLGAFYGDTWLSSDYDGNSSYENCVSYVVFDNEAELEKWLHDRMFPSCGAAKTDHLVVRVAPAQVETQIKLKVN